MDEIKITINKTAKGISLILFGILIEIGALAVSAIFSEGFAFLCVIIGVFLAYWDW